MKNWVLAFAILFTIAVILMLLNYSRLGDLFHTRVGDRPKRRLCLAAIGFFIAFAVARAMAWGATATSPLFTAFTVAGAHIHHLVWGMLLLLAVGICWLIEVGEGTKSSSPLISRLMSMLYGGGAALTLNEFALWLNVEDGVLLDSVRLRQPLTR